MMFSPTTMASSIVAREMVVHDSPILPQGCRPRTVRGGVGNLPQRPRQVSKMTHRPLNIAEDDLIQVEFLGPESQVRPYWQFVVATLVGSRWHMSVGYKEDWLRKASRRLSTSYQERQAKR